MAVQASNTAKTSSLTEASRKPPEELLWSSWKGRTIAWMIDHPVVATAIGVLAAIGITLIVLGIMGASHGAACPLLVTTHAPILKAIGWASLAAAGIAGFTMSNAYQKTEAQRNLKTYTWSLIKTMGWTALSIPAAIVTTGLFITGLFDIVLIGIGIDNCIEKFSDYRNRRNRCKVV
jgi:hypothetical protein